MRCACSSSSPKLSRASPEVRYCERLRGFSRVELPEDGIEEQRSSRHRAGKWGRGHDSSAFVMEYLERATRLNQ